MRHINGAYTNYFNAKLKRVGHLFQGRYKAMLVEADEYAKELSRYIHLNPVLAGVTESPEEYAWSSYKSYIGKGKKPAWLRTEFILGYFDKNKTESLKQYWRFVNSMIGREDESPLNRTIAATLLGSADFVKEITEKHINTKREDRNLPALRELSKRPTIAKIAEEVKTIITDDEKLSNAAIIYLCHKYSGASLKDIGRIFGIGESGASQASRRFAMKLAKDSKLKRKIEKIERAINVSRV